MSSVEFISGTRFVTSETVSISVLVRDDDGTPLNVPAVQVAIYNIGREEYWNGGAYQAGHISLNMPQPDQANLPGVFRHEFAFDTADPEKFIFQVNTNLGVMPVAFQTVSTRHSLPDTPIADNAFGANDVVAKLSQLLNVLKLTQFNAQEVRDVEKALIFFTDNAAEGLKFSLKDASGNLSAREVFRKDRI